MKDIAHSLQSTAAHFVYTRRAHETYTLQPRYKAVFGVHSDYPRYKGGGLGGQVWKTTQ